MPTIVLLLFSNTGSGFCGKCFYQMFNVHNKNNTGLDFDHI